MPLTPISDWCKHYALFFQDDGTYIGKTKVKFTEPTFIYSNRSYNFKPDICSKIKLTRFFSTHKFYLYNINNPDPYLLNKVPSPVMDSRVYKSTLENKLVEELNNLSKSGFLEWLMQPKVLITILVIGVIIWYFATGQHFLGFGSSVHTAVNSSVNSTSNFTSGNSQITLVGGGL